MHCLLEAACRAGPEWHVMVINRVDRVSSPTQRDRIACKAEDPGETIASSRRAVRAMGFVPRVAFPLLFRPSAQFRWRTRRKSARGGHDSGPDARMSTSKYEGDMNARPSRSSEPFPALSVLQRSRDGPMCWYAPPSPAASILDQAAGIDEPGKPWIGPMLLGLEKPVQIASLGGHSWATS